MQVVYKHAFRLPQHQYALVQAVGMRVLQGRSHVYLEKRYVHHITASSRLGNLYASHVHSRGPLIMVAAATSNATHKHMSLCLGDG